MHQTTNKQTNKQTNKNKNKQNKTKQKTKKQKHINEKDGRQVKPVNSLPPQKYITKK